MPEITPKDHTVPLYTKLQLLNDGYKILLTRNYININTDLQFSYALLLKDRQGIATLCSEDNITIVNVCFNTHQLNLFDDEIAQVNSVFVVSDTQLPQGTSYRGLGLAVATYDLLSHSYYVMSDTEQTEAGALLWRNKVATLSDLFIVDDWRFGEGILRTDKDGNAVKYTYQDSYNSLDQTIWGIANSDPRFDPIEPPLTPSYENSNIGVVLVLPKKR